MPKIQPRIAELISRLNVSQRFGVQAFDGSIDDLPIRTWRLLRKASQIMIGQDARQKKDFDEELRRKGAG